MMQQRFTKRAGFIDDWMDYLTHNAYQEAARLVPALGGRDKVLEMAKAKVATDPQWAARLATYLILSDEGDNEARQVRQQASVRFAQVTTSTNQRNYLLGLVAEENGDIDFDSTLRGPIAGSLNRLDDAELLNRLRNRVIAERANHVDITVRLDLTDGDAYDLRIINNVLRVSWPDEERVVASHWQTDKATIIAVLTDELTLAESLRSGRIATSDNTRDSARQNRIFAGLFE
jgi:alkyl sulfatase BDS1-like metallo-beta-lactamase superfamily hydrolase